MRPTAIWSDSAVVGATFVASVVLLQYKNGPTYDDQTLHGALGEVSVRLQGQSDLLVENIVVAVDAEQGTAEFTLTPAHTEAFEDAMAGLGAWMAECDIRITLSSGHILQPPLQFLVRNRITQGGQATPGAPMSPLLGWTASATAPANPVSYQGWLEVDEDPWVLRYYNQSESRWDRIDTATFLALTDTFNSFTNKAEHLLQVNAAGDEIGSASIDSIITQERIYTLLKEILQPGDNITLTENDTDDELEVAGQAGGGGGGTVSTDATLDGDGSAGDPLSLADDAVSTAKIAADAVHTAKINNGAVDNREDRSLSSAHRQDQRRRGNRRQAGRQRRAP